jgi:hypothetical protein
MIAFTASQIAAIDDKSVDKRGPTPQGCRGDAKKQKQASLSLGVAELAQTGSIDNRPCFCLALQKLTIFFRFIPR